MSNKKLVSVIIPTYNVEKFIKEAINSIINQTYLNIEIIIVDDCSTDKTFKILKEYEKKDSRIQVYKNNQNSKISYTLNHALKYAKGEYIARMDGDDISTLNRLQEQVKFLEQNNNIDLIGTNILKIDEIGNSLGKDKKITNTKVIDKTILIASPLAHPTWLGRKKIFDKLNGYREVAPAEDYDFLLRMKIFDYKFTNIDFDGLKLRIRDGNTASSQGLKQRKAVNYVLKLYKERLNNGVDNYSKDKYEVYVKSNSILELFHKISQNYFDKAVKNLHLRKKGLAILNIIISAVLSPYQAQFLYRWLRLRLILKNV